MLSVFTSIKQRVCLSLHALQERVLRWLKPPTTSLVLGTFADLTRGKAELLAENALLRQQLIILCRQVKRPTYRKTDRLWGAERIRGELLKLEIRVSKRTIQKYLKQVHPKRARGQTWRTFLHNHVAEVWACDFLQVTDLFFRPLFAFFIVELKSRKVIHVNVTRSPTDPWVAQHMNRCPK